jgi:hypothetical protein
LTSSRDKMRHKHTAGTRSIATWHGHAEKTCSKDMQHGHTEWTCRINMLNGQAAGTCSMDMRHGCSPWICNRGHAAITCGMDMQQGLAAGMYMRYGQVARACSRCMHQEHAVWMQYEHAAWTCCSSTLYICPCCSETLKICSAYDSLSSCSVRKSANFLLAANLADKRK